MRISDYPEPYYREVASATLTEENRARDRFRAYQRNLARRDAEARQVIEASLHRLPFSLRGKVLSQRDYLRLARIYQ